MKSRASTFNIVTIKITHPIPPSPCVQVYVTGYKISFLTIITKYVYRTYHYQPNEIDKGA